VVEGANLAQLGELYAEVYVDKLFMSDPQLPFLILPLPEKVKVSDQEFERRLRNKGLSKGGAPETSGLLRKTPAPHLPYGYLMA
jgi:hypothetical protein